MKNKSNNYYCKQCRREYRQNNKEKIRDKNYKYDSTIKGKIVSLCSSVKKRSKKKNIKCNIDSSFIKEMWDKQNGKCILTGISFTITNKRNNSHFPFALSIDRIDYKKGYTKNNVRLIIYALNIGLNTFGENLYKYLCKKYLYKCGKDKPVINQERFDFDKWEKYSQTFKGTITKLNSSSKQRALHKNLEFNLDKNYIENLIISQDNKCILTNIEFDYKYYNYKIYNPFRPSIDRIDPSKGYTKDNIRLVCCIINNALSEFGEDTFKIIAKAFLENY
jgi:hypothetical protein